MGSIIFSQYYDTAAWIAASLSSSYPEQVIALYAGSGKSRLLVGGIATSVDRAQIKKLVAHREVKLVVATDAACDGLNLQTLGTLINVDLPWNPSRLEQRIGRKIGRAHVCTPVTSAHLVCRLLLENKKHITQTHYA